MSLPSSRYCVVADNYVNETVLHETTNWHLRLISFLVNICLFISLSPLRLFTNASPPTAQNAAKGVHFFSQFL